MKAFSDFNRYDYSISGIIKFQVQYNFACSKEKLSHQCSGTAGQDNQKYINFEVTESSHFYIDYIQQ
jgi:hypothetical protein